MADNPIKTEIAGRVAQIVAAAGDTLAEEDPIVFIESMKMEIPIAAPVAGTLKSIAVAEGDTVAEGDLIAVMDA